MKHYSFKKESAFSREIEKTLIESLDLDYSSTESIFNYQENMMGALLKEAQKAEFYSEIDETLGLKEITKLPVINKETILKNFNSLINKKTSQNFQEIETSGSTGQKGRFTRTDDCKKKWFAHTLKIWSINNVDTSDKHAFITSRLSKDPDKNSSYFNHLIPKINHVALSIEADLETQIKWLKKENPKYLTTFPTNLEHMFRLGFNPNVKKVFTYSEPLNRKFKDDFETKTGIKIEDSYSTTEAGVIAFQCEYGNYHVNADNFYLEFLPTKQKDVFSILITIFSNKTLPVIRYAIKDLVKKDGSAKCPCDRNTQFFNEIVGRDIDFFSPERERVDNTLELLRKENDIIKFKIIKEKQSVTIPYTSKKSLKEENLKRKIKAVFPAENITLVRKEEIERGSNGKFPITEFK